MVIRIFLACLIMSAIITYVGAGKFFTSLNLTHNVLLGLNAVAVLLMLAICNKNAASYVAIRICLLRSLIFGLLAVIWPTWNILFGHSLADVGTMLTGSNPPVLWDAYMKLPLVPQIFQTVIFMGTALSLAALTCLLFAINKFINTLKSEPSSDGENADLN